MSTYVIFFGGWRATPADMQAWKGSAKAQKSGIEFDAIPWPSGAASDAKSAVSAFKNKKTGRYKSVIDDIHAIQYANAQSANARKIYIVGHSSGCAIANAVDEGLTDHSDVVLVALDGFVPGPKQLARQNTQVWVAKTLPIPFLDGGISRNYPALRKAIGSRLQVYYAAPDCTTEWALHFSLVNAAANDKIVTGKNSLEIVATGYTQCIANLVWL